MVRHVGKQCTMVLICSLVAGMAWAQEPADTRDVDELIRLLNDEDADASVRWNAVKALAKFGPEAKAAVPALSKH